MEFQQATLIDGNNEAVFPLLRRATLSGTNFELGDRLAGINITNHGDTLGRHSVLDPTFAEASGRSFVDENSTGHNQCIIVDGVDDPQACTNQQIHRQQISDDPPLTLETNTLWRLAARQKGVASHLTEANEYRERRSQILTFAAPRHRS